MHSKFPINPNLKRIQLSCWCRLCQKPTEWHWTEGQSEGPRPALNAAKWHRTGWVPEHSSTLQSFSIGNLSMWTQGCGQRLSLPTKPGCHAGCWCRSEYSCHSQVPPTATLCNTRTFPISQRRGADLTSSRSDKPVL